MIKVDLYDGDNKVICTLTLDSIHGKIKFSGDKSKKILQSMADEKYLVYIGGERKILTLDEPLEYITNLYLALKGTHLRASLPEFVE